MKSSIVPVIRVSSSGGGRLGGAAPPPPPKERDREEKGKERKIEDVREGKCVLFFALHHAGAVQVISNGFVNNLLLNLRALDKTT